MSRRNVVSLVMVLVLGAVGIWLLGRPSGLTPESASRQQARLGALAPAGASGAEPAPAAPSEQTEGQLVEPVVVNLADIPAGVYDPNNQFDRWQRGELDLDENESIVSEAQAEALRAAALKLEPSANIQQAQSGPGLSAPVLGISFPSIDINGCCGGGANVPPDPEMAAGPNHLIAAVNVSFQIYNKAGASLAGPITYSSFFCTPGGLHRCSLRSV